MVAWESQLSTSSWCTQDPFTTFPVHCPYWPGRRTSLHLPPHSLEIKLIQWNPHTLRILVPKNEVACTFKLPEVIPTSTRCKDWSDESTSTVEIQFLHSHFSRNRLSDSFQFRIQFDIFIFRRNRPIAKRIRAYTRIWSGIRTCSTSDGAASDSRRLMQRGYCDLLL